MWCKITRVVESADTLRALNTRRETGKTKAAKTFIWTPQKRSAIKMKERILWEQRGKSGRIHSANIWKEREKTGSQQMCNRTRMARVSGVDVGVLQTRFDHVWAAESTN